MNLGLEYETQPLKSGGQRLLYVFVKWVFRLIAALPRPWVNSFAARISGLWWRIDRRHREIALENLRLAYPEKKRAWIEKTARDVFKHFAVMAFELPYAYWKSPEYCLSMQHINGLSNLEKAISLGRGALLVSAHMGNWEFLTRVLAEAAKAPVLVIARDLDNPALHRIVYELRTAGGCLPIAKEKSGKHISRILGQGGLVVLLMDQNAAWFEGVYVTFFNRKACTNKGPAKIAAKTGSPVVPLISVRRPDGSFDMNFDRPLSLVNTGNELDDIEVNTQHINNVVEKWVRSAPEQWLWVHRRWRVLPIPDEARGKIRNPPE